MMRILEVILAPAVAGAETLVSGLARVWREGGHEVDVLALDPPSPAQAGAARALFGYEVPTSRARYRGSRAPVKQLSRLTGIRTALSAGGYDIAHSHCLQPNMYTRIGRLLTRTQTPVVTTIHSASDELDYASAYIRLAESSLQTQTAAVVAVSSRAAQQYKKVFPALAPKVWTIPNGVPRGILPRTRAQSNAPEVFLATSRITPQKDIESLVVGFDEFCIQHEGLGRLLIVGSSDDAEYFAHVSTVCRGLRSARRIEFLGPRGDIPSLLAEADVFVHSALAENHPISVLEAASAGIPVVATALPEVKACIGAEGYYFAPGDPSGLAGALATVAREWDAAQGKAAALAVRVKSDYSIERCARRYMMLFEHALSGSRTGVTDLSRLVSRADR